jgi:hypothetical protein
MRIPGILGVKQGWSPTVVFHILVRFDFESSAFTLRFSDKSPIAFLQPV